MNGDDPEFLEALRLAHKFFPESRNYCPSDEGLSWDGFLSAMMSAEFSADYSCYPFAAPPGPRGRLAEKGGLEGDEVVVYRRLLEHAGFEPTGRAIVVFDALGRVGWSVEQCRPFVCLTETVPERIRELAAASPNRNAVFTGDRDTFFIFESGEAINIDHDDRVYWARSRINRPHRKADR